MAFLTFYPDAVELYATVELIKSRTHCKGELVYLDECDDDYGVRFDHSVELMEDQKDLYNKISM